MGELIMSAPVAGLTSKDRITAEDVVMLRREVFADGVVSRGEAEALFALDATATDKCQEWPVFFVEAIGDYIVHQEKPAGYISEDNAEWLVRAISRDGMVDSRQSWSCSCMCWRGRNPRRAGCPPMRCNRWAMR